MARVAERGVCRANGRHYNGQYRPKRFSVELQERVTQSERRIDYLKARIEEEKAAKRATAIGNLARELAMEEKCLIHLQNSLARELAEERGELLDTPHWED